MDKLLNIGKSLLDSNEFTQENEKNSTRQINVISIPLNNLKTHGLIVGMTGSGKTGLGISLLENLILNDLPLIIIDPKADLTNLLLPFDSEVVKNLGVDEASIETWQNKLLDDGISKEIISQYKDKISIDFFTPGDSEGQNLALWHFNPKEITSNTTVNELEIQSLLERKSASLLELLSYENISIENPLLIYVSKLLAEFLHTGEVFSLEELIKLALNPPFNQVGAIPLDIFCSNKERQDFALKLNSLLLSSNAKKIFFGDELNLADVFCDSGRAFSTSNTSEKGELVTAKKKVLLFSLRALDEKERMLFVENILSELIYQIRAVDGSDNLRACFYMDEVYGYFPPVAMTPAKKSLITLIKQARSQGLSILLATQNPSDIDHKALSNISNIFIGRLNSETDRDRVINMILANMNSKYSKDELTRLIASLNPREFIYCSAKESDIKKFKSRQTISYLAGPLTAKKLKEISAITSQGVSLSKVTSNFKVGEASSDFVSSSDSSEVYASAVSSSSSSYSELDSSSMAEIEGNSDNYADADISGYNNSAYQDEYRNEYHAEYQKNNNTPPSASKLDKFKNNSLSNKKEASMASYFKNDLPYEVYYDNRQVENTGVYKPSIYASISFLFNDRNMSKPAEKTIDLAFAITDTISIVDFDRELENIPREQDLEKQPRLNLPYSDLPKIMLNKTSLNNLQKKLVDRIYRNEKLSLYFHPKLKIYSEVNENLEKFIERCENLYQETYKLTEEKLKVQYDKKVETVLNQIYRLQDQIEKAKMRVDRQKLNTVVQTGSTILDLLIGGGKRRSSIITKAGSSTKSHARSHELSNELSLLEDKMKKLIEKQEELKQSYNVELLNLHNDFKVGEEDIVEKNINLLKKDIFVNNFVFYWRS